MATQSPIGRIAYPFIASPRARKDTDKPRYSVCLVFPEGTDFTEIRALCRAAAEKKFPQGIPKGIKSPLRSGEERRRDDGTLPEGFLATDIYIDFWRYAEQGEVECLGPDKNTILASDIYSGCFGRVLCNASAYSVDGNKGVSLHLEAFQFAKDGERVGGDGPVDAKAGFGDLPVTAAPVAAVAAVAVAAAPAAAELPF